MFRSNKIIATYYYTILLENLLTDFQYQFLSNETSEHLKILVLLKNNFNY